jgi:NADPH-dependent 2,4-dienoyl-CoA reductase/sulfur reductase-like enzyme
VAHIAVIGGSLAGLRAVETLRTDGFDGDITVVNAEDTAPYDRPPLSKKFLSGEWEADRIQLRKPSDIDELGATWLNSTQATALNVAARELTLNTSSVLNYDACIIATGGIARELPQQPHAQGIHQLRTLHDAQGLREELQPGKKLVVIGAGFIGLEAAATAVARGCTVTVLEGLPAPLIRGLGEDMGTAATAIHATQGVNIRCNVRVQGIETQAGSVTGVRISDANGESVVAADVVLVGIGVAPATQWLEGSGLVVNDGVVCDAHLQAAPGVFAAGDVARWENGLYSDLEPTMRVEHWTTAAEQGAHAARNALAHINNTPLVPYSAVPFFWSDQFTARIQFLGRSTDAEEIRVVAGSVDEGKFAAAYMRAGRLVGVLGVSMPKVVMPSRKLLEVHTPWQVALEHYAGLAS